ncbi:hypothetical protein DP116_26765 [Brasilonema bromeliae SPC951]|uniref:Uncharacterized protein n=1 Tax=Brasilonema bromeliae SPC951 TaxID=385972 RepID=A0ABX1PG46_9CYAN|nr:hypothetical protein [Brasilonema bromeliae SPC951]
MSAQQALNLTVPLIQKVESVAPTLLLYFLLYNDGSKIYSNLIKFCTILIFLPRNLTSFLRQMTEIEDIQSRVMLLG